MSLVINTNTIANTVRNTLTTNQSNLHKSLARLSSGSKIVDPTDDAGGLAVATKLAATLNRNARTQQNVQNTISFLQVQDGALAQTTKILDRMSELKVMSLDPTKNSDDIANYDAEFTQLQTQLTNIKAESFNGIGLFNDTANLRVYTTEEGDAAGEPSVTATRTGLFNELGNITYGGAGGTTAGNGYYDVAEYNDQVAYTESDNNNTYFVKSTAADGSVRVGYIANDASDNPGASDLDITSAGHGQSFADGVTAGDIIELTDAQVDMLYDPEANNGAGGAKARVFEATVSEHAAGEIVFDTASSSFWVARGAALNYTDATDTMASINAAGSEGQFVKLSDGFPKLSDFAEFSTTEAYEVGDFVKHDGKLYVADGSNGGTIAAGGSVPGTVGNTDFTEVGSYAVSGADLMTTTNTLSNFSVGDFTTFIQNAATARAQNGAEAARMNSALEMLKSNQGNLDAARSRLADVDVALESTNLAKQNILVQSAAAMLSQANASQNVALQLLS